MLASVRLRFWIRVVAAVALAALAVMTLVIPNWIERFIGLDLDGGSGLVEWLLVIVCVAGAASASWLARLEWHRAAAPSSS